MVRIFKLSNLKSSTGVGAPCEAKTKNLIRRKGKCNKVHYNQNIFN